MKILQALLAALLLAAPLQATAMSTPLQSEAYTNDDEGIYENSNVDKLPQYKDGELKMLQDLNRGVIYPTSAIEQNIQGVVIVKFEVTKKGTVGQITILKSLTPEMDAAAIAAVKQLKKFKPALKNGKKVACWMIIPIKFRLQ